MTRKAAAGVQWQWEGDDGTYANFTITVSKKLEKAWEAASGTGTGQETYNGSTYDLDWVQMTQKNPDSSRVRKLRRVGPTGQVLTPPPADAAPAAAPAAAVAPAAATAAAPASAGLSWFWINDANTEVAFSGELAAKLNAAVDQKSPTLDMDIHGTTYTVNFATMKQRNTKTNFSRTVVARDSAGAKWSLTPPPGWGSSAPVAAASSPAAKKTKAKQAGLKAGFGGVVSALFAGILAKADWHKKLTQADGVVDKWQAEFAASPEVVAAGLDNAAAGRVFDACAKALAANKDLPRGDAAMDGEETHDLQELEPADVQNRPMKISIPQDELTFKCDCECSMCQNGAWYSDDDDDDDDGSGSGSGGDDGDGDDDDESGGDLHGEDLSDCGSLDTRADAMGVMKINVPKSKYKKCKCYANHVDRRTAVRRQWLTSNTICRAPADAATRIPTDLVSALQAEFRRAEDAPNPDWHPGSMNHVQDIVHPSSRCYVRGLHPDGGADAATSKGSSVCRWVASEFDVASDMSSIAVARPGSIHGCDLGSPLEGQLTRLLGCMLPDLQAIAALPSVTEARAFNAKPKWGQKKETKKEAPGPISLAGRRIQVIVKMASIEVTPDRPTFPQGSWHLEGVAEDRIVATGIYYVPDDADRGEIEPTNLACRVAIEDAEDYPQDGRHFIAVHHGYVATERDYERMFTASCRLGHLPTTPGSSILFPNMLQHRVSEVKLKAGETKVARRRIVVFWLVAPPAAGSPTPIGPTVNTVGDVTLDGKVGRAEADAYRELLMLERKYFVAEQQVAFARPISLCEH